MGLDNSTIDQIKQKYIDLASDVYEETENAYKANREAMAVIYEQFDEVTPRAVREKLSEFKNEQHFDTEYLNHTVEGMEQPTEESEEQPVNEIPMDKWSREDDEPYFRNEDGDLVYHLKSYPDDFFVMPEEDREKIYEWYSNWDGSEDSVNTICRRVEMRRTWFLEWKKKEGLTHDSEPFTPEEIMDEEIPELTDDLLMMRKKKLWKDWREKAEKETLKAAEKWWKVEKQDLEPVKQYLEGIDGGEIPSSDFSVSFDSEREEPYGLILGIGDTHIGRTVHGQFNHTVEDTIEQVWDMVDRTLERVAYWGQPEKVYLLFLGDIFQYDTTNRETGSGNRREAVGIPPEVLDAGFGLANDLVAKAQEIAPTTVRVVPGNHDPMLSRALMWQLNEQWSDSVDIEKNWNRRQYVQYQKNLIGLAHACKVKPSKLTDLMPREASDKWGDTDNRFYVYGHPHRPSIQQPDDTDIELLGIGTPCDADEYEHSKGYEDRPRFGAFRLGPEEGRIGMPSAGRMDS